MEHKTLFLVVKHKHGWVKSQWNIDTVEHGADVQRDDVVGEAWHAVACVQRAQTTANLYTSLWGAGVHDLRLRTCGVGLDYLSSVSKK